jgi:hypothetical protein
MTRAPDFDGIDGRQRIIKVMVSSRAKELASERQWAKRGIRQAGFDAVPFEDLDPSGSPPDESALRLAGECHVFVLILGAHISEIVRREYEVARKRLKDELLVFVKDVARDQAAQEFLKGIDVQVTRRPFKRPEELLVLAHSAVLAVAERAILDRQAMSIDLAFRPLLAEPVDLSWGNPIRFRLVMKEGDQLEGILDSSHDFDFCLVDEENWALLAASGKRLAEATAFSALDRGTGTNTYHLSVGIRKTAVYYLRIETWSAIGERTIAVRCDIRRVEPRVARI